jgi:hypothetical protein
LSIEVVRGAYPVLLLSAIVLFAPLPAFADTLSSSR